jgi:hypothetical protein
VVIAVGQKRIVSQVFTLPPLGIQDAVQAHYDIILETRHLLAEVLSRIKPIYVPGQSSIELKVSSQGNNIASAFYL